MEKLMAANLRPKQHHIPGRARSTLTPDRRKHRTASNTTRNSCWIRARVALSVPGKYVHGQRQMPSHLMRMTWENKDQH